MSIKAIHAIKGHLGLSDPDYRALLKLGVDVIETDIPRQVGPLLHTGQPVPASKAKYFRK